CSTLFPYTTLFRSGNFRRSRCDSLDVQLALWRERKRSVDLRHRHDRTQRCGPDCHLLSSPPRDGGRSDGRVALRVAFKLLRRSQTAATVFLERSPTEEIDSPGLSTRRLSIVASYVSIQAVCHQDNSEKTQPEQNRGASAVRNNVCRQTGPIPNGPVLLSNRN